jgi:fatty-acyl-CoA synthase
MSTARLGASRAWLRALERSDAALARPDGILAVVIEERALAQPKAPALLSHLGSLSYAELAGQSNRYARWTLAQSVKSGEVVCLLMANSPDYVAAWLGITRAGAVAALLNTNLTGAALLHCIRTVQPRHVIADQAFAAGLESIAQAFGPEVVCWLKDAVAVPVTTKPLELGQLSPSTLPVAQHRPPSMREAALLIFTSGTTGLPKAARVSHARLTRWSFWFAGMMDATAQDRMYNCLPMYHSVGGVVAVGSLLVSGGAVAIAPRFSASRFWDDIARWECTLFQYIGELCRYLVNAPPHPLERAHSLRLCCGNGLRAEVWQRFVDRFAIPAILEFYASTEGNIALYNVEGEPGALGRVPGYLAHRFGIALVQLDHNTAEPIRDATGRCVRCDANEAGEALGEIRDGNFEGYTEQAASDRKILRDVFKAGDAWFRTGDLMTKDAKGFYMFVDRLGDTYRWKGENVSTTEVADFLSACPGVIDAVVFGVLVPGAEGRAGMAVLAVDDAFELTALRQACDRLPHYARPKFVRVAPQIEATGTFKLVKATLAREGYGPYVSGDPCYMDDPADECYTIVDDRLLDRLANGAGSLPIV